MRIPGPRVLALLLTALALAPAFGQSPAAAASPGASAAQAMTTIETVASPGVPREFRGISLGMGLEEVKAALMADSLYFYRGEPDVSLLPRPNETIIEVSGLSYVRRAFFQFYEGKLFVMIFAMNESKMDHYSVYTTLSAKYGKPNTLSPSESVWSDDVTRLAIERPLAIKYIDLETFNAIKAAGQAEASFEQLLRADFLDSF